MSSEGIIDDACMMFLKALLANSHTPICPHHAYRHRPLLPTPRNMPPKKASAAKKPAVKKVEIFLVLVDLRGEVDVRWMMSSGIQERRCMYRIAVGQCEDGLWVMTDVLAGMVVKDYEGLRRK